MQKLSCPVDSYEKWLTLVTLNKGINVCDGAGFAERNKDDSSLDLLSCESSVSVKGNVYM